MKALVKKKPECGLWMDDVPIPEIGINDVLIKIKKTSIRSTQEIHKYLDFLSIARKMEQVSRRTGEQSKWQARPVTRRTIHLEDSVAASQRGLYKSTSPPSADKSEIRKGGIHHKSNFFRSLIMTNRSFYRCISRNIWPVTGMFGVIGTPKPHFHLE